LRRITADQELPRDVQPLLRVPPRPMASWPPRCRPGS